MADSPTTDIDRRLAARRFNEHVRLIATTLNAVALTTLGAAFILPGITGIPESPPVYWIVVAGALHGGAHVAVRLLQSED